MNWAELMKGIYNILSRGRLISPSMPVGDDWYLNLNSQKRPPCRNLGEHHLVLRSSTTSRGTVVLIFCLRMRSFPRTEVPTIFMARNICVGSAKNLTPMTKFTRATWLLISSLKLGIGNNTDHCSSKCSLLQPSSIATFTPSNLSFLWKGNSIIKSSTIVLNRYWNTCSFRPQFNQCCMNLPNCFPDGLHCLLLLWKLCPKFLLAKKQISALPLLVKQSYAANNIDSIIVDVNRHR